MSARTQSPQAAAVRSDGPVVVDPRQFARSQARHEARLPASALARLGGELAGPDGQVTATVDGALDASGRPQLHLRLEGTLQLPCRRCLGPVAVRVAADRRLVFVDGLSPFGDGSDSSAEAEDEEDLDRLPAVDALDLRELVEEEILLSLPMTAAHPAGACGAGIATPATDRRAGAFEQLGELLARQRGDPVEQRGEDGAPRRVDTPEPRS